MHKHKYLVLIAAVAAVLVVWRSGSADAPARPSAAGVPTGVGHFQGVGGCSARACHGGLVPEDPTTDRSRYAYTFALNYDKHPRAFAVLDQDLGRHIMKNLANGGPVRLGSEDARCLACHTVPGTVLDSAGQLNLSDAARALRREGVGCESCHGASETWLVAHTAWRTPHDREAGYHSTGMTQLDDLAARAVVCVGCHVGAPEEKANNLPARDVNHELIAAGHPRLTFEFASYLADMPPHWNEPADRERPAKAWVVGQAVQAEAELKLLQPPAAGPDNWPEFARFDCAACHHDLFWGKWRSGPGRLVGDGWDVSLLLRRMTAGD